MNKTFGSLLAIAVILAAQTAAQAGAIFITGHDSDAHFNSNYIRAGLDYLAFGQAADTTQAATRNTIRVGYLGNSNFYTSTVTGSGYTNLTFIDLDNTATWFNTAFVTGDFDVLMIGSGFDAVSSLGSNALNAQAAAFSQFFNDGGALFVHTDQGIGQNFYNFIPSFGSTTNHGISTSGQFSATQDGLDIGLTESIVDQDITHSYYTGVDTNLFTVFETYNPTGDAVALGLRDAVIDDDGGFQGVPEPTSLAIWSLLGFAGVGARRWRRR